MGRHFSVPKRVKDRIRIRLLDKFDAVAETDGSDFLRLLGQGPDASCTKRRLGAAATQRDSRLKKMKAFTVVCQSGLGEKA
jgi:hypothetical protein